MQVKLNKQQKELIEKVGVIMEKDGLTPAQARVVGLLMVCDAAELTFEEIHATTQLSKSAVSNALNSLALIGKVEYQTKPGDRKRYFFVNPLRFERDMDLIVQSIALRGRLFKEIADLRSKANPRYNADLKRLIDFMEFLPKEINEVFQKWKNRSK